MGVAVSADPSAGPEFGPSSCGGALAASVAALGLVERSSRHRGARLAG
jgi:hypothetical protein